MANIQGGTISVVLQGKDVGLSSLLQKIQIDMQRGVVTAKQYDAAMAQLDPVTRKNEQALLGYAQSLARVAEKQGDVAGAQRILATALGQVTPNTTAANNALNQLQSTIARQETAINRSQLSFAKLGQAFQGLIGSYFAVTTAAQTFSAAIEAGNTLEKQEATFRALSGSQEQYVKNLEVARLQQQKFGGSLNDTLENLSGFVNLSNRTKISLNDLAETARGLAIIDPVQGFKGASIALKEFFSGDITSLARRFEIPRDILNSLNQIEDPTAKFAALNAELAKLGITQELIAASANTTAVEYDRLSGAAGDALAQLGQTLGQLLLPAARGLTAELGTLATALTNLSAQGQQIENITTAFLTNSANVEQFNRQVQEANAQLPFYAAGFNELSAAQFQFAQNLNAIGIGTAEILARMQQLQPVLTSVDTVLRSTGISTQVTSDQLRDFQLAVLSAASVSQEGADVALNYAVAVGQQDLSIERATQLLSIYVNATQQSNQANQANTDATNQSAQATNLFSDALNANALEAVNNQIQTEALKQRQLELYNAALVAAQGLGATQQAAAALASQFNITTGEAFGLISALQQLNAAQAHQDFRAGERTAGSAAPGIAAINLKEAERQRKAAIALAKAQHDQALATGTASQKLKILEKDLADATAAYGANSAEAVNAQTALIQFQQQQDKARKKGGGAPKLTPNEKINNKLLTDLEKFHQKEEELERKHLAKIEQITADHLKKLNEQIQENEVSKRRSREQFYSGLTDAKGVDTTQFAAAYEQAFAKAQEIAQSGSAKLADEFLKLKQQHIEELLALEKEAADIRADEDISEADRAAALEFLAGRKKLIEDAQREEEQLLLSRGDAITNETKQRLDEEAAAYEEQTTRIGIAANNAAEIKINQSERAKQAVSQENKELARQIGLYDQINRKTAILPSDEQNINKPPVLAGDVQAVSASEPLPIAPVAPVPIISQQILLVQQNALWTVRDQGVIDTLVDQTIRLETKLQQVNDSLIVGIQGINDRLDNVRNALGNIRGSNEV